MSDREAFIRHIAAHPHDDLPRLVFADWLDERDDPLGLFIRTQIELDPIRDRIELPRVRELLVVEEQLWNEHRETWLEPAKGLIRETYTAGPHFRRGMPHAICLTAQELGEHGERLMKAFPTVRELAVCELSGDPGAVANHEFLRRVDVLELADIPDPDDFATLLESDLFGRQLTIRLWNLDFGTCPLFGLTPDQWRPDGIVEYVQLLGGVMAGELASGYDQEADECATEFNAVWGEGRVRVVRPFRKAFSVHEDEETFPAGHFETGRTGLLFCSRFDSDFTVAEFEGTRLVEVRYVPLPGFEYWDDTVAWFRKEHGFSKDSIRVTEFQTERGYGILPWPDYWVREWERGVFQNLRSVWRWMFVDGYTFEGLGGHWADHRGLVHSS